MAIERTMEFEARTESTSRAADEGDAGRETYVVSMDDGDGRLLAIEFSDPGAHHRVRYEYDDHRRCGPLKLPYKRTMFVDDAVFAEDVFERMDVSG